MLTTFISKQRTKRLGENRKNKVKGCVYAYLEMTEGYPLKYPYHCRETYDINKLENYRFHPKLWQGKTKSLQECSL